MGTTESATSTAWAACYTKVLTGEQPFTGPTAQAVIVKRFVQTPAWTSSAQRTAANATCMTSFR